MADIIRVEKVSKVYQDGDRLVKALDNVSLTVPEGESVAIVGASGSGKSTLLQLIGGLDTPTTGEITVHGQKLAGLSDEALSSFRNKTIGFVFQFFHLHDYLTAQENVALPLQIGGGNGLDAMERAAEMLKLVGLADRASHKPKQMSGGEMQRVAIARALANNPRVILADEPTGNLDKANALGVLDAFDEIARSGVSVVIITHDETIRQRFSRVVRLDKGALVTNV